MNTSGWFPPSIWDMTECNLLAVNTSIARLNKAGRKDVSQVRVGSYYWTQGSAVCSLYTWQCSSGA
ncbi:MAG: hypothetical protein IJP80_08985 [Bacteroidales bacterium]|nr:hypothetical protein [Bacteroidales bacterium]